MKVYGKVHNVMKKERMISIVFNNHLEFFKMTNKYMKDFKLYLYKKPYVFMDVNDDFIIYGKHRCREINHFVKIVLPARRKQDVFYDLSIIQKGVRALVNREQNRLFLDLEFSLASQATNGISEIVQYGIVLEDTEGNIILEDSSLVKPFHKKSLNIKTLLFLSRGLSDFENACSYIEFYQLLKNIISEYDPKIIAWGKNDILTLESSFKLNHLQPLDIRNRYMNLMHIIKNYYNYKQEKGLFSTYQEMTNCPEIEQMHDALEDALIEREIFHIFKEQINNTH